MILRQAAKSSWFICLAHLLSATGGLFDVLFQNTLNLQDSTFVRKNGMSSGYDLFGFGSSQMRTAVRHNAVGTSGPTAKPSITTDAMKWDLDR